MPYIKLLGFSGIVPRTGPTQLDPSQAQTAMGIKLQSQELRSWKKPLPVYTPSQSGISSIYRLSGPGGLYKWLTWINDVDVSGGPVADTTDFRVYYTGDGLPKKTNWSLATTDNTGVDPFPNKWLYMGVPNPTTALTLTSQQPVFSVTIDTPGSGYTSPPTVIFSAGTPTATGFAVLSAVVSALTITNVGSGYTYAPTLTIVGTSPVTGVVITNPGVGYTSAPIVSFSGGGGSGATGVATVLGGVVSYIQVTNQGSGYTSAPTVTLTGGGGTGAFASAQVSIGTGATAMATVDPNVGKIASINIITGGNAFTSVPTVFIGNTVTSLNITNGGSGYTSPPVITFNNSGTSGSNAVADAILDSGVVSRIMLSNGGSGYTSVPTVVFTGGGGTGVSALAIVKNQVITEIQIIDGGSGYSLATPPTISFTGGNGSGAIATAIVTNNAVRRINVRHPGNGYLSSPTVSFSGGGSGNSATAIVNVSGGGGSGATATVGVTGQVITSVQLTAAGSGYKTLPTLALVGQVSTVTVTNGGTGYTSPPTVIIDGGNGSGATATANLTGGSVTSISLTANGDGYITPPTVFFSGGGGSGATATTTLTYNGGSGASLSLTNTTSGITYVTLVNPGSGYTIAPNIQVDGGGGSGATVTSSIMGSIKGVTVTNGGGYNNAVPSITFAGGGGAGAAATAVFGTQETRSYVYTNVSTFGAIQEESGPSPAGTLTVLTTGSPVTITGFSAVPTTGYNITSRRIYRTVTGTAATQFQFVAEIPTSIGTFTDNLSANQLGNILLTAAYVPPPDDLRGLVSMPNGILAGFRDNEVWFCEPYLPHAWNPNYVLTVDFTIVGLGVYDTTLVVTTVKTTYLMTGNSPAAISQAKLPIPQPCVSKRSIASDQFGVVYASPNGLVSIGNGVQEVVTVPLYTRDEWQTLVPSTMLGVLYNNLYLGFHNVDITKEAIVLGRGEIPPLSLLTFDGGAAFVDKSNGAVYALSNAANKIFQIDADNVNNTMYQWKSKKFILPQPTNFAAFKVHLDEPYLNDGTAYNIYRAQVVAYNQSIFDSTLGLGGALNSNVLNGFYVTNIANIPGTQGLTIDGSKLVQIPVPADLRSVQLILYGGNKFVGVFNVATSDSIRIPVTDREYLWEVEITGNVPVREVVVATSIEELKAVA